MKKTIGQNYEAPVMNVVVLSMPMDILALSQKTNDNEEYKIGDETNYGW